MFYLRTSRIKWRNVFANFAQVLGCILYTYYIFERFCIPVFKHLNKEHLNVKMFVFSLLNCTLPGTLLLLVAFYAFLHCWLNAFAEMMRFADRMFYKDWWNSTNFSNYYRTVKIYTSGYLIIFPILIKSKYFSSGMWWFMTGCILTSTRTHIS
jgi:sterol O-acyltransferase